MEETKYQRILKYVDLIFNKNKKNAKFFYFDDETKKFIVDGNRFKFLPFDYHKFYIKDEFYIHVNVHEKKVMYYAYDIKNYVDGEHVNEEQGFMEWNDVEDCIYNFFVVNVKDLADTTTPYLDVIAPSKQLGSSAPPAHNYGSHHNGHNNYSSHNNNYSAHSYGTPAYKEREAFYDKLWALLKENKTSHAIDHIATSLNQMCDDKKFEELNTLIRMISFDKLNIPAMVGILTVTSKSEDLISARKDFFDKVKTHLVKTQIKPERMSLVLHDLEPKVATTQN